MAALSLPDPAPGLVLRYSYLWARQHHIGEREGRKDRPVAIVAAHRMVRDRLVVTVLPISHSPPIADEDAVELPRSIKALLGLDEAPSWVIVTESNDFIWPGPDLRPVAPGQYAYGFLPPRFFSHLQAKARFVHQQRRMRRIPRSE